MRVLLLPPIVMLMSLCMMFLFDRMWPVIEFDAGVLRWAGAMLILAGLYIAHWHARLFRKIGTNLNTFGEPGMLIQAGLFRRTRNPMYLGLVMTVFGAALTMRSLAALLVAGGFFALAHFWYIPIEEKAMTATFGDQYVEYRRTVRRWL